MTHRELAIDVLLASSQQVREQLLAATRELDAHIAALRRERDKRNVGEVTGGATAE